METFLLLAIRLEYLKSDDAKHALLLLAEIDKMLTSMRSKLLAH